VALLLVFATQFNFASRELILGVSVLLGVARAFQMPAQQALTPQLVPQHMLQSAVALSSSGMLYTTGATTVYVTCAVLLLVSAVLLGGATALLPIYARDILHTGPVGLGVLRSAPALGALVMSLAIAGAADSISVVTRSTLVQLETPNEMRARVSAVNSLFIGASNQLGEFKSGATAALFGAVGSVVMGGVGTVLIGGPGSDCHRRWHGGTGWSQPSELPVDGRLSARTKGVAEWRSFRTVDGTNQPLRS
jgi:hypothetical protein